MVFMQNFGGRGVPAERCCSECNNGKPEDCEKRFTHVYIQKMPLQMDGDSCGLCLLMVGQ